MKSDGNAEFLINLSKTGSSLSGFFRKRWRSGFIIAWACLAALSGFGRSLENRVRIGPPSNWVHSKDWEREALQSDQRIDKGMRYLLLDFQKHSGERETYRHYVEEMVNEQGVQDNGTLSFTFDPSYQELVLHRVRLHRDGRIINQLDRSELKIIQPEKELARNLYNGDQSATLFLKDLRVGDVLEYDYTLRGRNPVFADHFYTRFYLQSFRPIHEQFYRMILPGDMKLRQRYNNAGWQPSIRSEGNWKDYRWTIPPQQALDVEDYIPFQYDPYAYMEFSNFESWSDVVQWALPLYSETRAGMSADMEALVARWLAEHATPEARALAALHFLQDELRYLGIEFGPNSHQPSRPAETFERRFGDCKDKSYLLCTLLRALGVESWPALVNTSDREGIAEHVPSPLAFNHVIVQLQIGDRTFWVDPTSSHQGGDLENRYMDPYGLALVIRQDQKDLAPIELAEPGEPQMEVFETFNVQDYEKPVLFHVETIHRREDADSMREMFADTDRDHIANDYLNFYSRMYPGIELAEPLEIVDDISNNVFKIREEYRINEFWELDEDGNQWAVRFYPHSLGSELTDPDTRLRKMPLYIPYPLHKIHHFTIHLPEKWDVRERSHSIKHDAFQNDFHQRVEDRTIHFDYSLVTRRSEVSPDQVAGYLKQLDKMNDNLGDYLTRPVEDPVIRFFGNINWLMIVGALIFIEILAGSGVWLCLTGRFRPSPDQAPEATPAPELQGIRGWLVLLAIGFCLSPFGILIHIFMQSGAYVTNSAWQEIAAPQGGSYHPLFGPVVVFELIVNIALLALSIVMACLFFLKRKLFIRVFIIFLLIALIFPVLDEILVRQIPSIAEEDNTKGLWIIAWSLIHCLVWIPYMIFSRRVKSTFTR